MILTLTGLLDADRLEEVHRLAGNLRWQDGTRTAGSIAGQVKRNEQADLGSRSGAALKRVLETAIRNHPVLTAAAQPARFSPLLVSRTRDSGGYGLHYDNAFMKNADGGPELRTDLSYTLFLSDPDSYEGGALSLDLPGERRSFRPRAGTLILYPSGTLHEVETVTQGERRVAVGWIESRVRSAERREILFDLENLRAEISASQGPASPTLLSLGKVLANLKREFST